MEADKKMMPPVPQRRQVPQAEQIDLMELINGLMKKWKLIVLGMVLGAALLGLYYMVSVRKTYRADAKLFVADTTSIISMSDLQLGAAMTEDYTAIIKSRAVMNRVADQLGLDLTYNQVNAMVGINTPEDTHFLNIYVTAGDPALARDVANEVLEVSADIIGKTMTNGKPTIIDRAEASAVIDVTPGLFGYLAKGGLLGAFLICGLIVLKLVLDATIKNEADIERYLNTPILASVPYFKEKEK